MVLRGQARRLAMGFDPDNWAVLADLLEDEGHPDAPRWRRRAEAAALVRACYRDGPRDGRGTAELQFRGWAAVLEWLRRTVRVHLDIPGVRLPPMRWYRNCLWGKRFRRDKAFLVADTVYWRTKDQP